MAKKKIFLVQSVVSYPAVKIGLRSAVKYAKMLARRTEREMRTHPEHFPPPPHRKDSYPVDVRELTDTEIERWRAGGDPADL